MRKAKLVTTEPIIEIEGLAALAPKGRKKLINAAKHLVEAYLTEAGFTPLNEQDGYKLKNFSVDEELKRVFGPTTQAERDMHDALDLIADVMLGRPTDEMSLKDFEEDIASKMLGHVPNEEMLEIIARFNKDYRKVGGGKIRNIGLNTSGNYEEAAAARYDRDRRNPARFSFLKATSRNRFHVVLFGKLYSFGKRKAATAS